MVLPVLNSEQRIFIDNIQKTMDSCYPPRTKGFVKAIKTRIADLIKNNPFPNNNAVGQWLQLAAKNVEKFKDPNPSTRQEARCDFVINLERTVERAIPKLPDEVDSKLSFEQTEVSPFQYAVEVAQKTGIPLKYMRVFEPPNINSHAMSAAASRVDQRAIALLLENRADINFKSSMSVTPLYRLINSPRNFRIELLKFVLSQKPNPMARTLSGEWEMVLADGIYPQYLHLLMESVTDLSQAKGELTANGKKIKTDILRQLMRTIPKSERAVRLVKVLIFHGLELPTAIADTGSVQVPLEDSEFRQDQYQKLRPDLIAASEIYGKVSTREMTIYSLLTAFAGFSAPLAGMVQDYFMYVGKVTLKNRIARCCFIQAFPIFQSANKSEAFKNGFLEEYENITAEVFQFRVDLNEHLELQQETPGEKLKK